MGFSVTEFLFSNFATDDSKFENYLVQIVLKGIMFNLRLSNMSIKSEFVNSKTSSDKGSLSVVLR